MIYKRAFEPGSNLEGTPLVVVRPQEDSTEAVFASLKDTVLFNHRTGQDEHTVILSYQVGQTLCFDLLGPEAGGDPLACFTLNLGPAVRTSQFYLSCAFVDTAGIYYLQGEVVENEEVIYETCLRQNVSYEEAPNSPLRISMEISQYFNQLYPLDGGLPSLETALERAKSIASKWRVPYDENADTRNVTIYSKTIGIPTLYWLLDQGFAAAVEEAISFPTGRQL